MVVIRPREVNLGKELKNNPLKDFSSWANRRNIFSYSAPKIQLKILNSIYKAKTGKFWKMEKRRQIIQEAEKSDNSNFPEFSWCPIYPLLGAKEAGNPEIPTGTDKKMNK